MTADPTRRSGGAQGRGFAGGVAIAVVLILAADALAIGIIADLVSV